MQTTLETFIAKVFAMTDETWQRHANPWSVWTRATVLPIFILAIWSRVWIEWWSLFPVMISVAWAWFNPRLFPRPRSTDNWASKSVLGERVWLNRNNTPVPTHHRRMPIILNCISVIGLPFVIWGLWQLALWPTFAGCVFLYTGKFWFLDRMVWLYEDMKHANPEYSKWLYEDND